MKLLDYVFNYTTSYSKDRVSFICEKIKNPTPEALLFYYINENTISAKELNFLINTKKPNINKYNRDGDTPIMNALMHFSLSQNEVELLNIFEKIKVLTQFPINYDLINVDGENVYCELLMRTFYKTDNTTLDSLKLKQTKELLDLFTQQHPDFSLEVHRSSFNYFELPSLLAKEDKHFWSLSYLIKKGLNLDISYLDEDGEKKTLYEWARENNANKNKELIFNNLIQTVEKNKLEASIAKNTIGLDTIEKTTKLSKSKL